LKKTLFVISGPSGSGKSTIVARLCETLPDLVSRVITVTTRPKRGTEVDGADYRFVSEGTFKKWVVQDLFVEFAYVYGCWYGTLREDVEVVMRKVPGPILVLDTQGAATMAAKFPEAILIGVLLKREEVHGRLRSRGDTAPADVTMRANGFLTEEAFLRKRAVYLVQNSNGAFSEAIEALQRFIVKCLV
jgi:guanylate kinase